MKHLAKLSFSIAIVSIAILLTWCIGFLVTTVFDLKIFKENTSEFLGMAILPILAAVAGAALINIISNIGIIANHITNNGVQDNNNISRISLGWNILLALNIVVVGSLFIGDKFSTKAKQKQYEREINLIIGNNMDVIGNIQSLTIDANSVNDISEKLEYLNATNTKLMNPSVIFRCEYNKKQTLCEITLNSKPSEEKIDGLTGTIDSIPNKLKIVSYLYRCDEELRIKLNGILDSKNENVYIHYSENESNEELYKFVMTKAGPLLLNMSKYARYGKYGS